MALNIWLIDNLLLSCPHLSVHPAQLNFKLFQPWNILKISFYFIPHRDDSKSVQLERISICYTTSNKQNIYLIGYFLACNASDSQSIAWSRPSPRTADVLKIWKVLSRSASSPSAWCTSATVRQPAMSCLLANTTRMAFPNSSSYKTNINP